MALSTDVMGAGFPAGQAVALGGSFATIAAAGAAQATATLIGASNNVVTGATGTEGVRLPAANGCDSVLIVNNSASSLLVYPPTGAAISVPGTGMGTGNSAYTHTTYATCVYTRLSATQWTVNKSA